MANPIAIAQAIASALASLGSIAKEARDLCPRLEDEVTVEVVGQPGANRQQLYFLALAAANGLVRRFGNLLSIGAPYGMLMIEYNAAEEWVRCTIRYNWSMLTAALEENQPTPGTTIFDNLVVYRGPACEVVGGNFDFVDNNILRVDPLNPLSPTTPLLPGIPNSSLGVGAPSLPFQNQPILTQCPTTPMPQPGAITVNPAPARPIFGAGITIPSPNPKPPGDNRSRGAIYTSQFQASVAPNQGVIPGFSSVPTPGGDPKKCCDKLLALIPMVTAALSAPATNSEMTYIPPLPGPNGQGG